MAEKYFQKLFTSEKVDQSKYDNIFQGFQGRVTPAMNLDLTREITEEEVRTALFQMGPNKAPGPELYSSVLPKILGGCQRRLNARDGGVFS